MRLSFKLVFVFAISLLVPARSVFAAEDLKSVLAKLDAAAKTFHTTSADFTFDTEMVDPVPDTDIQKGKVYYERNGRNFQMAAHITEHNKRPASSAYTFTGGVLRFREGDQVHVYQAGKWESYLMLGFGASGTDLTDKWNVKYIGPATIEGKPVERLELVAKDPAVLKNISKVTIWVDTMRGVSLQQRFDQGSSTYRICKYTNIRVNGSLPSKAFDLKANFTPPKSTKEFAAK